MGYYLKLLIFKLKGQKLFLFLLISPIRAILGFFRKDGGLNSAPGAVVIKYG